MQRCIGGCFLEIAVLWVLILRTIVEAHWVGMEVKGVLYFHRYNTSQIAGTGWRSHTSESVRQANARPHILGRHDPSFQGRALQQVRHMAGEQRL